MVMDAARSMLHRSLLLVLAALRTVINGPRRPLRDSLVDLDAAPAVPVADRERLPRDQITAAVGASRAPPALAA